jgi:hypothetical protein
VLLAGWDELFDPPVHLAVASVVEAPDPLGPLSLGRSEVGSELPGFCLGHLVFLAFVLNFMYYLRMTESREKVMPKRLGRPATGRDPVMSLRMPPAVRAKAESWAKTRGLTLSKAIVSLVELGLAASAKRSRTK